MLFTTRQKDYVFLKSDFESSQVLHVNYLAFESVPIPLMLYKVQKTLRYPDYPTSSTADTRVLKRTQVPWFYLLTRNLGIVLMIIFTCWYLIAAQQEQHRHQTVLATPQAGDLFFADMHAIDPAHDPRYRFTLMQIENINDDRVTLQLGKILYTHEISPFGYLTRGAYTRETLISLNRIELTKQQLRQFAADDTIYDIKRPEGELIDGWLSTRFLKERYCHSCMEGR